MLMWGGHQCLIDFSY